MASTIDRVLAAMLDMAEGDRIRVLQFADSIVLAKAGKRRQRVKRFAGQVDESWRIGNVQS